MTTNLLNKYLPPKGETGFSLVEVIVAMVMFAALSAGLAPLMIASRAFTLQSDNRIGAIAISQEVMDSFRQMDVVNIPSSGANLTTLPSGNSIANLPYKGKTYSATVTYCQTATYCDAETRHILVKVYIDGNTATVPNRPTTAKPIYQLETIYARLQ